MRVCGISWEGVLGLFGRGLSWMRIGLGVGVLKDGVLSLQKIQDGVGRAGIGESFCLLHEISVGVVWGCLLTSI